MKRDFNFLCLLGALLFVVGTTISCGSGRSDITEINKFSAEQAASDLYELANQPDFNEKVKKQGVDVFAPLLQKMRSSHTLVLKDFWQILELQSEILDSYVPGLRLYILRFSTFLAQGCEPEHFHAFSRLALKSSLGLEVLSNQNLRHCQVRLEDETILRAMGSLNKKYQKRPSQKNAGLLANFLVTEYNLNSLRNWLPFINEVSPKAWKSIGVQLMNSYDGKSYQKLLQIHIHSNSTIPFAGAVASKFSQSENLFKKLMEQVGFESTLDILRYADDAEIYRLEKENIETTLLQINQEFSKQVNSNSGYMHLLQRRWNQLLSIRNIQNKLAKVQSLDKSFQISWVNNLHSIFEKLLFVSLYDANDFLNQQDSSQLDLYWFKYRLRQKMKNSQFTTTRDLWSQFSSYQQLVTSTSGFVDNLLQARLLLRLNNNNDLRSQLKDNYCKIVGEVNLNVKDVSDRELSFSRPGCYFFRFASQRSLENKNKNPQLISHDGSSDEVNKELVIKSESLIMSADSALFFPAVDLTLQVDKFDLSHIDLSADQYFVDYPVEATPPEYDGLSFPVALLVNAPLGSKIRGAKILLWKFDFQPPWSGQKWADEWMTKNSLRNGVRGGRLTLNKVLTENKDNFLPSFQSFGGQGQVWERDSVKGGQGWSFELDPYGFILEQHWWKNISEHTKSGGASELEGQNIELSVPLSFGELDEVIELLDGSTTPEPYIIDRSVVDNGGSFTRSYIRACQRMIKRDQVNTFGEIEMTTLNVNNQSEKLEGMYSTCTKEIAKRAWNSLIKFRRSKGQQSGTTLHGFDLFGTFDQEEGPRGFLDFYSQPGRQQKNIIFRQLEGGI